MIIRNFNIVCISGFPSETYSPLVIDPDAVFSFAVPFQGFQSISGRNSQGIQIWCGIQNYEFSPCKMLNILRQFSGKDSIKYFFGFFIPEKFNHVELITR
jgi:hypothetical protein